MDIGTIVIAVVITGICVLPFALIYYSGKRKKNTLLSILRNLASKNNANITKYDIWKSSGIGIDEGNNHLFFFRQNKENISELELDLARVKKCRVEKNGRNVKSGANGFSVLDRVDLVFENGTGKISAFPIYISNSDMQLVDELEIVQKWEKLVNERLPK